MAPESRGVPAPKALQSQSTPNLSTLATLDTALDAATRPQQSTSRDPQSPNPPLASPSEAASVEDNEDDLESEFTSHFSLSASSSEDEGEADNDDDDDQVVTPIPPPPHPSSRPLYLQPSRSYSYLGPPFYNRPPTPLPPSPSLTSLLRPPFSATPSRPATPDSSDVEAASSTPTSTGASLQKSARAAPSSLPRASPKVPTYEYYGFVLYLASSLAFLMYLLWAYLPAPFLSQMGVHYYPNRWWALAVPAWLVMAVLYIYAALATYNTGYLTLKMESLENIVDEAAQVAVLGPDGKILRRAGTQAAGKKRRDERTPQHAMRSGDDMNMHQLNNVSWRTAWSEGTDAVLDVPIGGVCEILYGAARETGLEDEEMGVT